MCRLAFSPASRGVRCGVVVVVFRGCAVVRGRVRVVRRGRRGRRKCIVFLVVFEVCF